MFPIRDHENSGKFPYLTVSIIVINIIVYIIEITVPDPEAFIYRWSLVPANIDANNRLTFLPFLTSQFLHAGLMHILSNMWFLKIFGDNVEASLGRVRFLLFYLGSGIAASLLQLQFMKGLDILLLGASGAIAGVLGYYLAKFSHHRVDILAPYSLHMSTLTIPAQFVLFLWFITQLFNGTLGALVDISAGGVAWWAHIGGFIFGYLTGKIKR